MIRLFVAIGLDSVTRTRLALLGGVPGARWSESSDLHLTLRFIGQVPENMLHDIDAALATVIAEPFDLEIAGVGQFSHGSRPHTLWAGIAPNPTLEALHDRVERALTRAGLAPEERRYTPHITLARLSGAPPARVARFLTDHALLRIGPIAVDRFALMQSQGGPPYRTLADYALGEPADAEDDEAAP